jgi:hypothetical protein
VRGVDPQRQGVREAFDRVSDLGRGCSALRAGLCRILFGSGLLRNWPGIKE